LLVEVETYIIDFLAPGAGSCMMSPSASLRTDQVTGLQHVSKAPIFQQLENIPSGNFLSDEVIVPASGADIIIPWDLGVDGVYRRWGKVTSECGEERPQV
jgi:hypothetical protein